VCCARWLLLLLLSFGSLNSTLARFVQFASEKEIK